MNTPNSSANTQNSSNSSKSLKNITLGAALAAALMVGAPGCSKKTDDTTKKANLEMPTIDSKKTESIILS